MTFKCGKCTYSSFSNLAAQLHVQNEHPKVRNNHGEYVIKSLVDSEKKSDEVEK